MTRSIIEEDDHWWYFAPRIIETSIWDRLRLMEWVSPTLSLLSKFKTAIVQLAILTGHAASMHNIPETDEVGQAIIQNYVSGQIGRIISIYTSAVESMAVMVDQVAALSADELSRRPSLLAVIELWQGLGDVLRFDEMRETGVLSLGLQEMTLWFERLRQALPQVDGIRLLLTTDALDRLEQDR